jgi:hypothetical protein
MRTLLLVLTLLVPAVAHAAPKSPRRFGLEWGSSVSETTTALSQKLSPQTAAGLETPPMYVGKFADFTDAFVVPSFFREKLAAMSVVVTMQGRVPISTTWEDAVNAVRAK